MRRLCFPLYNTICEIGADGSDQIILDDALRLGEKEARRVDQLLNRFDPTSALSNLNNGYHPGEPYPVVEELCCLLALCEEFRRRTGGAFQIATGGFSALWAFESPTPVPPKAEELRNYADRIRHSRLQVDIEHGSVTIAEPGIVLDLGAVGKGYGADQVSAVLQRHGVERGYVDFGGNLLVWGKGPSGGEWTVGVQDPRAPRGKILCRFPLPQNMGSATSGGYDRYFWAEGQQYHHLLAPQSGMPVNNGLMSTTVVADSATLADILSTSCFLLGKVDGRDLLEKLEQEHQAGGIFVDNSGEVKVVGSLSGKLQK